MSQGLPGLRAASADKRLGIYLNDHLGGSAGGVDLARRAAANNFGTPRFGPPLAQLAVDIEEDRTALLELMSRLGVRRDPVKERVAWAAEKVGRLKLNGQLRGYSPLSRLVELEGLTIAVTGKLSLWQAVRHSLSADPRLHGFDLQRLAERARQQRALLGSLRLEAAQEALVD